MKEFLLKIVTSHSGISSKRVCGCLGWLICLGLIIYCLIKNVQSVDSVNTVLYCCCALLGVDSISNIFKK